MAETAEQLTYLAPVTYTAAEVAEWLGVPYRTLMHWVQVGLLQPSGGGVQGNRTTWTLEDAHEAGVVARARAYGVSLRALSEVMPCIRGLNYEGPDAPDWLVFYNLGSPQEGVQIVGGFESAEQLQSALRLQEAGRVVVIYLREIGNRRPRGEQMAG